MTDTDILQDACELIYSVDPDATMEVRDYRVKHGSCRLLLTFRVCATDEAIAYVHGDLVKAGCVYVEEDDAFIPIRLWLPQGNDIELRSHNLHRTRGKGTSLHPAHPALAIGAAGLGDISEAHIPKSPEFRRPRTRKNRSRSLRELSK